MIPPINVTKDERKRQNKNINIHPITEVKVFLFLTSWRPALNTFCVLQKQNKKQKTTKKKQYNLKKKTKKNWVTFTQVMNLLVSW